MGLFISFAGMLTYKNAAALRDVARQQPLDRLLVETDSPYLAPVPVRGKRNEPAWTALTVARLAAVRGVGDAEMGLRVTENAARLFGIAPVITRTSDLLPLVRNGLGFVGAIAVAYLIAQATGIRKFVTMSYTRPYGLS